MSSSNNLALFDFDGCITTKDTFWDFIKQSVGTARYLSSHLLLSGTYLKFHTKRYTNGQAKEKIMAHHFAGFCHDEFNQKASLYANVCIDRLVRPNAINAIKKHKDNGDRIVVVSGSFENWIKPWCDKHDIETIGSRLEVENGLLTGNLHGTDCIGPEKVRRVHAHLDVTDYHSIIAYGDSSGDKEMLEMADISYFNWKRI